MPLIKSGSKQAVSENVRREVDSGRPQKQAIAIALDIARRAKKAAGGAVGYADGGAPNDARISRQIQERAMRGLDPTPEQQAYLEAVAGAKEANSARMSRALPVIANEMAKGIAPPVFPGWNVPTMEEHQSAVNDKLRAREGMSTGERALDVGGEYLREGLPYAASEIGAGLGALARSFPKTTGTLAGGLGMFGFPTEGGAGERENIMRAQERLRDQGYYQGPIDGNNGKLTQDALKAQRLDQQRAADRELEKERLGVEKAKQQNLATRSQERATGEEKIRELEKNQGWGEYALKNFGPAMGAVLGAGLGAATRYGVKKAYDASSKATASRADKLLDGISEKDLPDRVARLNQFWTEGGKRDLPYKSDLNKFPAFDANPKAAPSSDLYQPNRAASLGIDLGIAGGAGTESALINQYFLPEAKDEVAAARQAVADDPSEVNISRWRNAENRMATLRALDLAGRGAAGSYLLSGLKMQRSPSRPDIAGAEGEKLRIDSALAAMRNPALAESGRPTALLPTQRSGPLGLREEPGMPGIGFGPAETMPALGYSQTSPGLGAGSTRTQSSKVGLVPEEAGPGALLPSSEALPTPPGLAASSAPETATRFVPLIVSPTGRVKYAAGVPEDLGVKGGRFAKGEHRPTKKQPVPRKKAAEKEAAPKKAEPAPEEDLNAIPKKPDRPFDPDEPINRGMNRGGAVSRALRIARRAVGGRVHTGPITHVADGGRTDTAPMDVAAGSYIIPADIISSLGQGDTNAGYRVVETMFGPAHTRAEGGAIPIIAAGGEYALTPEQVTKIGQGDVKAGHEALDQWVKMQRRKTIQTLKGLPGPAKD